MKKYAIIPVMLMMAACVMATTVSDIIGDRLEPGKISASYKERYFEYDSFYIYNNNLGNAFYAKTINFAPADILSGIEQDFILRGGITDEISISADLYYVYQKIDSYNFSQAQDLSLVMDIYGDKGIGLLLGVRAPLTHILPDDLRLIDEARTALLFGLFTKGGNGFLSYTLQAGYTLDLDPFFGRTGGLYGDEAVLNGSFGFNLYNEPKKQVIDIIFEGEYSTGRYDKKVLKLLPQARMKFYDDFTAIVGIEALGYADNAYLYDNSRIQYVFKIDYMINSSNRKAAAGSDVMNGPVIPGQPGQQITPQLTPQLTPQITPTVTR